MTIWAIGNATIAATNVIRSKDAEAHCHPSGHDSHSRAYQGRADHARAAASTRGNSVAGASGTGSARNLLPANRSSSKKFTLLRLHQPAKRFTTAMDIRLHLAKRHSQSVGDVLVAHLFEVKQHQRHS